VRDEEDRARGSEMRNVAANGKANVWSVNNKRTKKNEREKIKK
jgi:hypothetical protein